MMWFLSGSNRSASRCATASPSLRRGRILALVAIAVVLARSGAFGATPSVSFNRDIRPLMSDICWRCHGPGQREGGIRLDVREAALGEVDSGLVPIAPGDPEGSEAIRRIFSQDESERMPPPESNKSLTDAQKELFRRWVAEGAVYDVHWAYQPLRRPPVPKAAEHPVDAFVLEKLKENDLPMSAEAEPADLLRRLSFDLTGLPPTPEEAAEFASGRVSYETFVDRMLDSQRFAERQTQLWLDVVRFADTRGFHSDEEYPIWPYRDYVLHAFHENLPFDQFTREQLAGDMLPNATVRQRVASAFNRLNRTSVEGGIQEKEYVAKYGADRVRTIAAAWLAQTFGCAECHDHKYDPITQADFYALKAFFADMKHPSATGGELELPSPEQARLLADRKRELKEARTQLSQQVERRREELPPYERAALADEQSGRLAWQFFAPYSAISDGGVKLTAYDAEVLESELNFEGSQYVRRWPGRGVVVASGPAPDRATYELRIKPGRGTWAQLGLEVFSDWSLPGNTFARGNVTYHLSGVEAEHLSSARPTPERVTFDDAVDESPTSEPSTSSPLAVLDDDDATTWSAAPSASISDNRFLAVRFSRPLTTSEDDVLVVRLKQNSPHRQATIGRFRLALASDVRCWPAPTAFVHLIGPKTAEPGAGQAPPVRIGGVPTILKAALEALPEKRTAEQEQLVSAWQSTTFADLREAWRRSETLRLACGRLQAEIPVCQVSEQADQPTTTRILPRGDWMSDSGEIVAPAIPTKLGRLSTAGRATRLDLADWIVSDENPLTARVVANRLWQQFFGAGLSRTIDDFGSQGEWPVYAELLDWLACELRDPTTQAAATHRWDYKHLVRVVVTSNAYRQSSLASPAAIARDPDNRLLSRQNRHRLDAEEIRDMALATSGLLRERFGGPSVHPVQSPGYLSSLNFPRRDYPTSQGDDLWRRSLYTFWQRTFLHPTLATFDACSREEATASRAISNTPLQSLVLLNDPVFVEAARALAQSVAASENSVDEQLDEAFARVLSRRPRPEEHAALTSLYDAALQEFSTGGRSEEFLAVGDAPPSNNRDPHALAALTATTRAILNLHEAITRN
jgi:hypothetical protein